MIYPINIQAIPQSKRQEINNKILYVIDAKTNQLPKEAIFNCYTGIGGLHDLNFHDFDSFHDYTEAKKEIEMGQFFTPHDICKQIVDIVQIEESEKIIDMCCGSGNFFNYMPNLNNVRGFDIDENAIKVAKHLYPEANINVKDIRHFDTEDKYDVVIGNPPFNLKFKKGSKDILSQFYYCAKAAEILNPAGLLVLITPMSFLNDEFWNKTQVNSMNKDFSFVGQYRLPNNAFKAVGVESFSTKILIFQKKSETIKPNKYISSEFVTLLELKDKVTQLREEKRALRLKLVQEQIKNDLTAGFEYQMKKYLYEIRTHKILQPKLDDALEYVERYNTQEPPKTGDSDIWREWEKTKITPNKVLAYLKRIIKTQDKKDLARYRLKKHNYSISNGEKTISINSFLQYDNNVEDTFKLYHDVKNTKRTEDILRFKEFNAKQLKGLKYLISKKRKEFAIQSAEFEDMERIPEIDKYIDTLSFINPKGEVCYFTELQKHDMGLIFQKRYGLLNWQQGSGKTAVAFHYGKYQLQLKRAKIAVVLAPPLAIELTWKPFFERNGQRFVQFTKRSDLDNVQDGDFVTIPNSLTDTHKKLLQRFVKSKSNKVCLLFDESDEITNPLAKRTRSALDIFRRCKYKLNATGTTTRNNIGELYPQFELLYNNSVNMINECEFVYFEDKEGSIIKRDNDNRDYPFSPRGGHIEFRSCFCPSKTTVFGIEKQNQDIYNADELRKLINKTVITRKFKEFAGEKYTVTTHNVKPSSNEREVYRTVIEEFYAIRKLYFTAQKDSKKDAMLRIIQQMNLLIKACSTPNYMPGYGSNELPSKTAKIIEMIEKRDEKVAIGCTTLEALEMYVTEISHKFFNRPLFVIHGGVSFKKRQEIIANFEATFNGILVCTQQSLKSSVNIPTCNEVIMESLQWNIPKMEQFYFRFIRLDSEDHTNVHFINYVGTIEQNIMALVLTKERINEFIKSGEVMEQSAIFDEFGLSESMLDTILTQSKDDEGRKHINWGKQYVS